MQKKIMNFHKMNVIQYPLHENSDKYNGFKAPSFLNERVRPVPINMEIIEDSVLESQEVLEKVFQEDLKNMECNNEKSNELDISHIHTVKEFYETYIQKTEEECKQEGSFEQKSKEWLKSRHFCITASQFGAAVGLSPYQSGDGLVKEKISKSFKGNSMTEYGNLHEPHAREIFCEWLTKKLSLEECTEIEFQEYNLMKFPQCPWIGLSPDGIVTYKNKEGKVCYELIEYKCPARFSGKENPYKKYIYGVPPMYMAQMQGIMGFINENSKTMNLQKSWFVVWLPMATFISEVQVCASYFNELKELLNIWYFEKYLPELYKSLKKN